MNRKLTATFAAMLIALMAVGVSYALWSKTLYIFGTVDTGDLDAVWTSAFNFDPPGPPPSLDPNPDGTRKDKDVGWTTVDGIGTQELIITVHNGYPCYFNDLQVEFTNVGNVPVIIQSITIIPVDFALASDYGANDGELWVALINGIGTQLEPGDDAASSFKIHVEQCAEELATYTFTVEVLLVQWNEYVP
jgi:hypothetical protein